MARLPTHPDALADAVLTGEPALALRAGARLMRLLDDRVAGSTGALRRLHSHTGHARILGVTGNPGSGKSTLVDRLVAAFRARGERVGVVAIDPSSPFSGGAILGDRIRMMAHALDEGVFVRSLATRGAMGGLSRSTGDVVQVLDAMGFDRVIIETVGVGQDEIDIVRTAHTTVVVLVPGLGDDIQAIKAGIVEIADVFAVNKADRDGADRTVGDLMALQALEGKHPTWQSPIVKTIATRNEGVDALIDQIEAHATHLAASGEISQRLRMRARHTLDALMREGLSARLQAWLDAGGDRLLDDVVTRDIDPYTAAERAVEAALGVALPLYD